MLRCLFDQPPREEGGLLTRTTHVLHTYKEALQKRKGLPDVNEKQLEQIVLRVGGFIRALDELEQSVYAASQYCVLVHTDDEDAWDGQERLLYHRHLYFYKNGFIRVFSILDKIGNFLNELLQLETGKVKSRYSYFTVLRQMHERKKHRELEKKLYLMKLKYQDSMGRLRTERNMELHAMNMEFHDDPRDKQGPPIETMNCNLDDLNRGYEHVCLALHHVFNYLNKERIYEHAAR